ncbi:MAG: thioredoxin TrxC [Burkholderiaceae bacterium]|nr:thioredoxin TrxC [Burkholderiaceae bacterium]
MDAQTTVSQTNVVCPHCHTTNRVPEGRLSEGLCGRCGKALFDAHPVALTGADFDRHIAKSELPVVVDFWAPWCGPCRTMAPVFERAAKELEPRFRFVKVNTDEEQELAARHGIRGIPTLAIFRNGVEVARLSGAMDATRFMAWVRENG